MKFSSKVEKCGQSPMRKFHPYAVAAKARGIKVYHLNIGQPDVQTPPAFFEAIRKFEQPVLEYAPSPAHLHAERIRFHHKASSKSGTQA